MDKKKQATAAKIAQAITRYQEQGDRAIEHYNQGVEMGWPDDTLAALADDRDYWRFREKEAKERLEALTAELDEKDSPADPAAADLKKDAAPGELQQSEIPGAFLVMLQDSDQPLAVEYFLKGYGEKLTAEEKEKVLQLQPGETVALGEPDLPGETFYVTRVAAAADPEKPLNGAVMAPESKPLSKKAAKRKAREEKKRAGNAPGSPQDSNQPQN